MILSHRDSAQVKNLAGMLRSMDPSAVIAVSHDARDKRGVTDLQRVPEIILTSRKSGRGDFGLVDRWRDMVESISAETGSVDYVVLISGQDYPIAPADRIRSELVASGDGYMEHFDVLDAERCPWRKGQGFARYYFRWFSFGRVGDRWARRLRALHVFNRTQPVVRINLVYGRVRIGIYRGGPPSPMRVYGGSQWHALSWRAVETVLQVLAERGDIVRWARGSLVSDEAFFQTVLLNNTSLRFSQGSRRYYDFSGKNRGGGLGHPRFIEMADLEAVASSGEWFARKVDWKSSGPLMNELNALTFPRGQASE